MPVINEASGFGMAQAQSGSGIVQNKERSRQERNAGDFHGTSHLDIAF